MTEMAGTEELLELAGGHSAAPCFSTYSVVSPGIVLGERDLKTIRRLRGQGGTTGADRTPNLLKTSMEGLVAGDYACGKAAQITGRGTGRAKPGSTPWAVAKRAVEVYPTEAVSA
jgi:hypothetical protein